MRRLLALLGGIALLRTWLRRRGVREAPRPAPDARAEELRRRLEDSRTLADDQEAFASGETPVDAESVEERRRDVHERGRATIDDLRGEE